MRKILYLILVLVITSNIAKSQELRPFQFIQFFKAYQLENSIHLLSGTECLKGYDRQWMFIETFTVIGDTEDMHFWAYRADNSKQFIHKVSGSTNKTNGNHYVEYEFDEPHLYQQYLKQIIDMNSEDGGVSKVDGGTGRIYNVGGLTFVLRTFPAGIKAEQTVYTIALTEDRK